MNPSKMNMEIDSSPTDWLDKFIIFSKKELELSKKSLDDNAIKSMEDNNYYEDDDYNYDDDDEDNIYNNNDNNDDEDIKNSEAQCKLRMIRMGPLLASQPRLEPICKDWRNRFLPSCFTTYVFNRNKNDSVNDKANDLEYLINLCGVNLTYLDVKEYPVSEIMPIINANCPNLEILYSRFKEIMSQDFENVFSNMSHLRQLSIEWQCENSTLPMTLAKSLEQIGGTLKSLHLSCTLKRNDMFSLDSLTSVFPRLIALNCLDICGFGLSQLLLQSIGEIKTLVDVKLMSRLPKNHPMFDTKINMYPIGNLKNLEKLRVDCDYSMLRDEFLINLCNNAKKLTHLFIPGTNITDIGMSAIYDLEELKELDLGLIYSGPRSKKNESITDKSTQCLFKQNLTSLDNSNCANITDESVIKLVETLPNLTFLYINGKKITREAVKKIYKLVKNSSKK
ncbi:uncharacterized protein LOC122849030 [Aphidius gifuensis]|uniref:uncharacterized protein LOC122849030 n=1 Tax=Aphidius gifuensis TaxID=684658 RepID=UPI001CDD46DC|nr:uncharacterized protein LOC122849030 [Aphidius gifuensis]